MRIGEHKLAKQLITLADKMLGLMEMNYKEYKKQVNLDRSLDQFHSYLSEIFKILDNKWVIWTIILLKLSYEVQGVFENSIFKVSHLFKINLL